MSEVKTIFNQIIRTMNNVSLAYLILIIAPLFTAYRGPLKKNEDNASARFVTSIPVENGEYVIDKKESVLAWKCLMVYAGKGGHSGYVYISKGELMIEKSQLVGGSVEVDMSTIEDERHNSDNNLINHLKDPDFFDVKKFPISTFSVTKVASVAKDSVDVTGNLTIKGITHEVTFPTKIEVKSKTLKANGKLTIDRTKWDVRYGSGKFFDNLADRTISDEIEFDMTIMAKK
jgi:polyisoprenoid-binding protein YceI